MLTVIEATDPPPRASQPSVTTAPARPPTISRPAGTLTASTLITPEQALADVEAARVRGLLTGMTAASFATMMIVLLLGGDPVAGRLHAGALGGSALLSGTCALLFRDPKRFHPQLAVWVIGLQIIVLVTGFHFWGVFSAYGALVPLTLYIIAGVSTDRQLFVGIGSLVIAQTTFGLLVCLGHIASRGLVEPVVARAPLTTQLLALALLQAITIGAAIAGREARKTSRAILEAHHKALRELAQREAQLAEAYAEARAAREAAAGGAGRFTDQSVDDFRLGSVLGRGAMGEVYDAQRIDDGTPVAVKVLAPHLLRDRRAIERFIRECTIVSALESPHIVRVLAVSPPDALLPYIAMERLEGTDLASLIKRETVRPIGEVVEIVEHVAAGLDVAHEAGVIHRDLKPSNVFATPGPRGRVWKLLDFGTARWENADSSLSEGNLVGTPGYMSPEQALGKALDHRSDVYALGVILYRLVTGVPAVVPGEVPAMLLEVTFRMPLQPSKRAPVSPEIEAVLAIAVAKNVNDRFASAGDLAKALAAAAMGKRDPELRARAARILQRTPWGSWAARS